MRSQRALHHLLFACALFGAMLPAIGQPLRSVPRTTVDRQGPRPGRPDARLARFATANAGNPAAIDALRRAAAAVQANPSAFAHPDGSVDAQALAAQVRSAFANAGAVAVPGPDATLAPTMLQGNDADIMALCFIVMMQAATSARDDLKSVMEEAKAANERKRAQRNANGRARRIAADVDANDAAAPNAAVAANAAIAATTPARSIRGDADDTSGSVKDQLDSRSELGQTESLRLQMAMDRKAKLLEMLTNLLKKTGDTDASIIDNLK